MADAGSAHSPAKSVAGTEFGFSSSKKRRTTAPGGMSAQVDDEMTKAARRKIDQYFEDDPRLALRVAHMLDTGKLQTKAEGEGVGDSEPIPASCNKYNLLRKERWQLILENIDPKRFAAEATEFLTKDDIMRLGCFALCVDKSCALPQTKGNMQVLLEYTKQRYIEYGRRLDGMEFQQSGERAVAPDWANHGAFRFGKDGAGNQTRLIHLNGASVPMPTAPMGSYSLKNNYDERDALVVDTRTEMEKKAIKYFDKTDARKQIPEYLAQKTVKEQPLEPGKRMRKKGSAASACALLEAARMNEQDEVVGHDVGAEGARPPQSQGAQLAVPTPPEGSGGTDSMHLSATPPT